MVLPDLHAIKRSGIGLVKLTRFHEYVFTVCGVTLFGIKLAGGTLGINSLIVLVANLGTVAFAFMFNDTQDAPEDAVDEAKQQRNPISSGELTRRKGLVSAILVAILAAWLFSLLPPKAFLAGISTIVLSWLYSWRITRLKAKPIVDILVHVLMLGGLQLVAGYYTFTQQVVRIWPMVGIVLFVSAYGELWNELRDYDLDLETGVQHSASVLGKARTRIVMHVCLVLCIALLVISVWQQLLPLWLVGISVTLGILYIFLLRGDDSASFIRRSDRLNLPIIAVATIILFVWFIF